MQKHTVTLQDDEFRLFRKIRDMNQDSKAKKRLIEKLVQEIEDFLASYPLEEMNKWLQVGDKTCFRPIEPVKPKKSSPLASQIIIEQRNRLIGNTK